MRLVLLRVKRRSLIKAVKDEVEKQGKLNKQRKISQLDGVGTIYTLFKTGDPLLSDLLQSIYNGLSKPNLAGHDVICVDEYDWELSGTTLESIVRQFCEDHGVAFGAFEPLIPRKWTVYEPLLLLGENTLEHPQWDQLDKYTLFAHILETKFPKLTHIAVNRPIDKTDVMRRPASLVPVYGDFGPVSERARDAPSRHDLDSLFWCSTTQNGIRQTWSPLYTMFSRGNITEKARILRQFPDLHRSYAVDLYAGIGYFTLSYARNGATVLCWEINPWSIEALQRNCRLNNFSYKLIRRSDDFALDDNDGVDVYIFHESNEHAESRLAGRLPISHINLGLLPSSQQSWPTARSLLARSTRATIVHVHENVHVQQIETFGERMASEFNGDVLDIIKVKTFAPDVWHIVVDVQNGKVKK